MSLPRRTPRAWTLALALLATLLTLLAMSAPPGARAAQTPITTGPGLNWGLKESWRNYIGAAGTTTSNGATINADGTFHFPILSGSYDDVTHDTTVQFRGTLQFLSHCEGGIAVRPCALDMTMADPRVEITEDGAFLYAKMTSRPITGGEIVDYPAVKIAELDVEAATPTIADGTTSWAGLPATVSPEGSAVFTYPTGTIIDPVSFAYDGPGGKPAGEQWSTPDVAVYANSPLTSEPGQTLKWTLPGRTAGERFGVYGQDSSGFALLDAATYAVKPGTLVDRYVEAKSIAFDPATATAFYTTTGANVSLEAHTWNGSAWVGGPVPDSEVPLASDHQIGGGVWDAVGKRYLLPRIVEGDQQLWQVKQESGAWTASSLGSIRTGSGLPLALLADLDLAPGGYGQPPTLVAANGGVVRQLHVVDGRVIAEPLPQANGATAVSLFRTKTGLYAVGGMELRFLPILYNTLLEPTTPPLDIAGAGAYSIVLHGRTTVDFERDRLFLPTYDGQSVMRIDAGALTHRFQLREDGPDVRYWTDFLAGTTTDGTLVHSAITTAETPGLTGRRYAGRTPSFTTQPTNQAVQVSDDATTASATFSVAVAGEDAPALRWQTRALGQTRWTVVEDGDHASGATTAALTVEAGAADAGRQYRAIATNAVGEIASARATLDVQTPPTISVQPDDVAVVAGDDAQLKIMPLGNPAPQVTWQQRIGGYWRAVDAGSGDFSVDGGFLTVRNANVEMSGSRFRAKLENAVGTTYSRAVTLTVNPPLSGGATFGGGYVEWGVSNRWRCYVVGNVARGGIDVSGGVQQLPGTEASGTLCAGRTAGSESLRFPVVSGTYDTAGRLEIRLGGSVRFWGHDYHVPGNPTPQLDTVLTNLRIVIANGTGILYADATGATMEHPVPVTRTGIALAQLDASGSSLVPTTDGAAWSAVPAALTADGVPVFGSYPAGEPLDDVSMSLVFGTPAPTEPPAPGEPTPDPLPVPVPVPPVVVHQTILVAPPVVAPAPAAAPRATTSVRRKTQRVNRKRRATLATIACPAKSRCKLTTPKRVTVRIAGKRYRVTVRAPKSIAGGKRAAIRVQLPSAALRALRGRTATVRVKTTVNASGTVTRRTVKAKITARKATKTATR